MKDVIDTGLAPVSAPISWATVGNGILFTAQIPFDRDGKLVGGDIREQTAQTLRNLGQTLRAAGGTLEDVTQVVVFLVDLDDFQGMNETYREFFEPPYPNRATLVAAGLAVPGMRVEMLAYASLGRQRRAAGKVSSKRTGRAGARSGRASGERRRRAGTRASP
jgi:2-iminobutanoate/2-iminopropanoate deaminase